MKKNYICLSLLLLFSTILFGQRVTLTPTMVNGVSVSTGPINLGGVSYSSISLSVKVEVPANAAIGDQGTIKIYYSKLSPQNANVTIGGDGGQLYFGGGKVANRSFMINLSWGDFFTSGGFIYAEYKNSNSTSAASYKSSNIAVIKDATLNGSGTMNPPADAPDPSKTPNTLCCNQIVRLGDKPAPITGSQYLNPYQDSPYGINFSWEAKGNPSVRFQNLDNVNKILNIDYISELGDFNVTRSLGYNYSVDKPNKSNVVTITVVPSPILTNTISTNNLANSDGYYELSNATTLNLYGISSKINLTMLQDPTHTNTRGDIITDVDGYKWEYKNNELNSNPWITIPNESNGDLNFSDPSLLTNPEDSYYLVRRIATYQNTSRISNEIKILIRGLRYNNTICCDQVLKITPPSTFESPQIITGSAASLDNPLPEAYDFQIRSITYQWQSQSLEGGYPTSSWSNISGATSKDYLPSLPLTVVSGRRGNYGFKSTYKFRRIATIDYLVVTNKVTYGTVTSYSNETNLDGTVSQPYIKLYPNPASSTLNIESTVDIANAKVKILNILGNVVNSNNFSILSPNIISINVADLPTGTYFITIENGLSNITQKTFIKQ